MKKFFVVMAILSMALYGCTTDGEKLETENQLKTEALASFDIAFKNSMNGMILTRSVINDAEDFVYDSLMALAGRDLCVKLKVPTDVLLDKFGITDQILLETYNAYSDSLQNATTFEEYKCFTALTLYDVYKTEKMQIKTRTLDAWNVAGCIALGRGFNDMMKWSTRQIAQFAVKKLASRLVPYIGWGWGIASAAYCISEL